MSFSRRLTARRTIGSRINGDTESPPSVLYSLWRGGFQLCLDVVVALTCLRSCPALTDLALLTVLANGRGQPKVRTIASADLRVVDRAVFDQHAPVTHPLRFVWW